MTFAVVAVQRARTPFAVHVLDVSTDTHLPIPSGRDTAFVMLLGIFKTAEHAEDAREALRGVCSFAQAVERISGSGFALIVAERHPTGFAALTILRARGTPLPVVSNGRMTSVAVLAVHPTQPSAAMALNRVRDACATCIADARAVLADAIVPAAASAA